MYIPYHIQQFYSILLRWEYIVTHTVTIQKSEDKYHFLKQAIISIFHYLDEESL